VWAASLGGLGCSGGDGEPLGGPFGGTVPPGVMNVPEVSDSGGVLPLTNATNVQSASGDPKVAPTWTQLFDAYLAAGKVGNCAHSGCHQNFMGTPSAAFSWLHAQGQLSGPEPAITDPSSSCLSWLGGDMPPGGPLSDPVVERDFEAWVKAGAKDH
jgi:hypothetical protein